MSGAFYVISINLYKQNDILVPQFIVNEAYCRKYNVSKKEARNLSKKLINYEKIGELYDPTLTDKKNIELFKQYGLSISNKTLQRFRGEMGLKKYKKSVYSIKIVLRLW